MWICQNNSFVSIVKDRDSDNLLCRARKRSHLVEFVGEPHAKNIFEIPFKDCDYQYRILLPLAVVLESLDYGLSNIDYDNFKSSVEDHDMYKMYSEFWSSGVRNLDEHPDKFDRRYK